MKLRTGTPVWICDDNLHLATPPLTQDVRCRVAVLGGGITGALAAYQLVKRGVSVVLLDHREIGRGSTAASTGLLQYEVDTPLSELIKLVGENPAVHAYRRGLAAIDEIESIVGELGDTCQFARRDSLYFASTCWHERRLKREFACRKQYGFDVEYLSKQQLASISSIAAVGAIRSRGDAQIDPFRFTQRLIEAAMRKGLIAHTATRALEIDEGSDCVAIKTEQATVRADKIVYAAGYETQQYLSSAKGNLNSTYALASQANVDVPGWPQQWLLWETARPYFYARRTEDGRVIMGGGDTEFATDHQRDQLVDSKIEKLLSRFNELFPKAQITPEFVWAGTFAETKDGLAYIGQTRDRPRAYFALGYGGNGITFSTIAAKLIADLFSGVPNPDESVFRFDR